MRSWLGGIVFAIFIMLKLTGPLVAWSWWWLLMPIVPTLAFLFENAGWL